MNRKQSKPFFFEKNNQETLAQKVLMVAFPRTPIGKSFCFFFQKEVLSLLSIIRRQHIILLRNRRAQLSGRAHCQTQQHP